MIGWLVSLLVVVLEETQYTAVVSQIDIIFWIFSPPVNLIWTFTLNLYVTNFLLNQKNRTEIT